MVVCVSRVEFEYLLTIRQGLLKAAGFVQDNGTLLVVVGAIGGEAEGGMVIYQGFFAVFQAEVDQASPGIIAGVGVIQFNGPLWLSADGDPLTYFGMESLIRRLKKISGVNFHAHALRHTFATMMARGGINVFDLKEMLGHTSITTTQIYVRQNMDHLNEVHQPHSPLTGLDISDQIKRRRGRPRKDY